MYYKVLQSAQTWEGHPGTPITGQQSDLAELRQGWRTLAQWASEGPHADLPLGISRHKDL